MHEIMIAGAGTITAILSGIAGKLLLEGIKLVKSAKLTKTLKNHEALAEEGIRFAEDTFKELNGKQKFQQAVIKLLELGGIHNQKFIVSEAEGLVSSVYNKIKKDLKDGVAAADTSAVAKTDIVQPAAEATQVVNTTTAEITDATADPVPAATTDATAAVINQVPPAVVTSTTQALTDDVIQKITSAVTTALQSITTQQ